MTKVARVKYARPWGLDGFSIQGRSQTCFFHRKTNALARTVEAAWIELDQQKLQNVFVRWKKVLEIIIADDGDNMQVAQRKGKLFSVPSDDVENIDDDDCEDVNDEVEQGFNFSDGHDPDK